MTQSGIGGARPGGPTNDIRPVFSHWSPGRTAVFLAVLTFIAISPALLVKIPAMMDYPDNLARMYLLVTARHGEANSFYQVDWGFYPNLAMDLIVPQLARFMSVETAARVFLILSELLVVSGAVSLELTVKRRMGIAGPAALVVLYAAPFAFGLINYEFSLGLSLWAIAFWIRLERRAWPLRFGVHACFVFALFLAEAFGLGLYGLTIGLYELSKIGAARDKYGKAAVTFGLMAAPAIAVIAVAALSGAPAPGETVYWKPLLKLASILLLTNGYNPWLSAVLTSAIAVYVLSRREMFSLSDAGRWIAWGFLICFLILPFELFNAGYVDFRLPAAALLVLPAFTTFALPARQLKWAPAILAAVIGFNAAYVGWVWLADGKDYKALKTSFRLLGKDPRVLVGSTGSTEPNMRDLGDAAMLHEPTLAVYYARALVPTLFAFPGLQPVTLRPQFAHYGIPETKLNGPVSVQDLKAIAAGADQNTIPKFVRHWPDYYGYLYLLGHHIVNPIPGLLREIDRSRSFTLYRIRKH